MEKGIKDLIEKYILDFDEENSIDKVYGKIESGEVCELSTNILKNFYKDWLKVGKDFQIDLPFLISERKVNKKTIMIIGMDANNQGKNTPEDLVLSAPFYLQSDIGRNSRRNQYWNIIEPINENYNVYLTDVYKLFFREDKQISNKNKYYTQNIIHATILQEEILYIKPELIVAFGKASRDICAKIFNIQLNGTITIPHPSNLTRPKYWKSFYFYNLKGEDYKDYYKRPKCISKLIMDIINQ